MSQETPEKTTQSEVTPSKAHEFKRLREQRNKATPLTLPSGLVVLVKKPSLKKLIMTGHIPDSLAASIMKMSKGKGSVSVDKLSAKDLQMLSEFQQAMAKAALVSPVIVENPDYDKNEISIEDLDDDDIAEIAGFSQEDDNRRTKKEQEVVDSFRDDGQSVSDRSDMPQVSRNEA